MSATMSEARHRRPRPAWIPPSASALRTCRWRSTRGMNTTRRRAATRCSKRPTPFSSSSRLERCRATSTPSRWPPPSRAPAAIGWASSRCGDRRRRRARRGRRRRQRRCYEKRCSNAPSQRASTMTAREDEDGGFGVSAGEFRRSARMELITAGPIAGLCSSRRKHPCTGNVSGFSPPGRR